MAMIGLQLQEHAGRTRGRLLPYLVRKTIPWLYTLLLLDSGSVTRNIVQRVAGLWSSSKQVLADSAKIVV